MSRNVTRPVFLTIGDGANSITGAIPLINAQGVEIQKGDMYLVRGIGNTAGVPFEFLTTAAAALVSDMDSIHILYGTGDQEFELSPPMNKYSVQKATRSEAVAPTYQETYIGLNADGSGSLPINALTEYRINVLTLDDQRPGNGEKPTFLRANATSVDTNQTNLVDALIKNIYTQGYNGTKVDRQLPFRLMANASLVAPTAQVASNDITAYNGSKLCSSAGTFTLAFGGATISVGDFISFYAFADATSTTAVYDTYQIEQIITDSTIILSRPYSGPTKTFDSTATNNTQHTTDSLAGQPAGLVVRTEDDFGTFEDGLNTWTQAKFETNLLEITPGNYADVKTAIVAALVTNSAETTQGVGFWKAMYDLEWDTQAYKGVNSRARWFDVDLNPPLITKEQFDVLGITSYVVYNIEMDTYSIGSQSTITNPIAITTILPTGSAQADNTAGGATFARFGEILESYLSNVLDVVV